MLASEEVAEVVEGLHATCRVLHLLSLARTRLCYWVGQPKPRSNLTFRPEAHASRPKRGLNNVKHDQTGAAKRET